MAEPCVICCGSKRINLPVRKSVSYTFDPRAEIPTIERDTSRNYACPECCGVPDHQLHVIGAEVTAPLFGKRLTDGQRRVLERTAADEIARHLHNHEMIDFVETPHGHFQTALSARLAVVTPDRITSLEQRVKEATGPALAAFARRAADRISVWGRDVGRSTITKDEAVRFINETLRESER